MKVRAVQFSPALGNIAKNMDCHAAQIIQAGRDGQELIVFPELSLSGYHLKDAVYDAVIKKKPTADLWPGPIAFIPALVASGIDPSASCSSGFRPADRKPRPDLAVSAISMPISSSAMRLAKTS